MKKDKKTPPDSIPPGSDEPKTAGLRESKTAGLRVMCTNSIEKPLEGGGFDRFTAGEIYDPADYDYPLGKPNFKSFRQCRWGRIKKK